MEGKIVQIADILKWKGGVPRFALVAKHCGYWHDVRSVNRWKKTIRLYNEYGLFVTPLSAVEEIRLSDTWEEENPGVGVPKE